MKTVFKPHEDFIVSHLRSQIMKLGNLVTDIENRDYEESGHLNDVLGQVEISLRQLRKNTIKP